MADPKFTPRKLTTHIVLHCSASPRETTKPEDVEAWHKARGFVAVGYAKMIGHGKVYQGRPDDVIGAHAEGFNAQSIGVCWLGNPDTEAIDGSVEVVNGSRQFKDLDLRNLVQTLAILANKYGLPANQIIGHRDVYGLLGQRMMKTCPGKNLYALMPEIRKQVAAYTPDKADDVNAEPAKGGKK